jgi:hypothetical protein
MLAPFLLWAAENHKFLEQMTEAEWEYVGYQERSTGQQLDGSQRVSLSVDDKPFILFKQRPIQRTTNLAGMN